MEHFKVKFKKPIHALTVVLGNTQGFVRSSTAGLSLAMIHVLIFNMSAPATHDALVQLLPFSCSSEKECYCGLGDSTKHNVCFGNQAGLKCGFMYEYIPQQDQVLRGNGEINYMR